MSPSLCHHLHDLNPTKWQFFNLPNSLILGSVYNSNAAEWKAPSIHLLQNCGILATAVNQLPMEIPKMTYS